MALLSPVQLLADEYNAMSPGSLEDAALTHSSHYHRINLLTHPASPEAAKKIAGQLPASGKQQIHLVHEYNTLITCW